MHSHNSSLLRFLLGLFFPCQTVSATSKSTNNHISSTLVYQFSNGPTWIENIATRSNNQVLLSLTTAPEVYMVNPHTPNTKTIPHVTTINLLHTFPYLAALGIVELHNDIFYLILGNSSSTSFGSGTYSIWSMNLTSYNFTTNTGMETLKVADFPDSGLLNGITVLDQVKELLAISDSVTGVIHLLNTQTLKTSILLSEPEMTPPTPLSIGINGLKTLCHKNTTYIYFSNTGKSLFARVPIDLSTLTKSGPVEILNDNVTVDDFTLDPERGVAWLAGSAENTLLRIPLGGGEVTEVFGNVNSTLLPGPTSVALGRGRGQGEVYVTTSGRFNGGFIEGGKVVSVDVGC
jgi:hypothetical protein